MSHRFDVDRHWSINVNSDFSGPVSITKTNWEGGVSNEIIAELPMHVILGIAAVYKRQKMEEKFINELESMGVEEVLGIK